MKYHITIQYDVVHLIHLKERELLGLSLDLLSPLHHSKGGVGTENLLYDVITKPVDRLEVAQKLQLVIKAAGTLERTAEHPLSVIRNTGLLIFTGIMLPILFWYVLV